MNYKDNSASLLQYIPLLHPLFHHLHHLHILQSGNQIPQNLLLFPLHLYLSHLHLHLCLQKKPIQSERAANSKSCLLSLLTVHFKEYQEIHKREREELLRDSERLRTSKELSDNITLSLHSRAHEIEVTKIRLEKETERLRDSVRRMEKEEQSSMDIVSTRNSFSSQLLREVKRNDLISSNIHNKP